MLGFFSGTKTWVWAGAALLSAITIPAVAATTNNIVHHKHHQTTMLSATTALHKTHKLHTGHRHHKALQIKHKHAHTLHHQAKAPKAL